MEVCVKCEMIITDSHQYIKNFIGKYHLECYKNENKTEFISYCNEEQWNDFNFGNIKYGSIVEVITPERKIIYYKK